MTAKKLLNVFGKITTFIILSSLTILEITKARTDKVLFPLTTGTPTTKIDPSKWADNLTGATTGLATGTLESTALEWINFALGFVATIAVLMIIIGGFYYITGEEEGKTKGQKWIVNAIIGIIVIMSAWVIVNTFL